MSKFQYKEEDITAVIEAFGVKAEREGREEPALPEFSDVEKEVELKRLSFKTGGKKIDIVDGHLYIDDEPRAKLNSTEDLEAILKLIMKLDSEREKEEEQQETPAEGGERNE
jgi:hypothetical protein